MDLIVHQRYCRKDRNEVESVVSVLMISKEPGIQCVSISTVVKAFFSMLKAEWNLSEKSQVAPLQVRWVSRTVMSEDCGIKCQ